MQDAFAYCEAQVRAGDKDRFLAALFAPAQHRAGLFALYAFNLEIARIREAARGPTAGEIRLQWWRDVLAGEARGAVEANPVAAALLAVIAQYGLEVSRLRDLIDARRFDLYDEPMRTLIELEAYADAAAANLMALYPRRGQLYVPLELLQRHGSGREDVSNNRATPALRAGLAELCSIARRHLRQARKLAARAPADAMPAFLPVALAGPMLARMERDDYDPFVPVVIAPWRRQWRMWRAAREPRRIFS